MRYGAGCLLVIAATARAAQEEKDDFVLVQQTLITNHRGLEADDGERIRHKFDQIADFYMTDVPAAPLRVSPEFGEVVAAAAAPEVARQSGVSLLSTIAGKVYNATDDVAGRVLNVADYLVPGVGQMDPFGPLMQHMPHAVMFPQDIWNLSVSWINVTIMHPAGVISNVNGKRVVWADVNYLSLNTLYVLTLVAYPALLVAFILGVGILVSLCMAPLPEWQPEEHRGQTTAAIPASCLMPYSRKIYAYWVLFCRMIPALMVFGIPAALMCLSYPYPQEVFVLLMVVSSVIVFSNGIYMIFFVPFMLAKMTKAMKGLVPSEQANANEEDAIIHWVAFPNYKEDMSVVEEAIASVAQSGIARSQICLLLAMEERELEAQDKATKLEKHFKGKFREIAITYHPANLPNDPPGKASNMSWAFKFLLNHLAVTREDSSRVVLTVADADSDFHPLYFNALTQDYVSLSKEERGRTIFQAPIFHIKNYHRQPMPLTVGTMFTSMSELAVLSDPNAIRFPYSTYSIPVPLATGVGGWDPEWIAEDWHMGIKCFLLTLGQSQVRPIFLPAVNYMPEDNTWTGTIYARWAQAKRHALGFSDMSYYFMMLPLMYATLSKGGPHQHNLRDFWMLFINGISYLVRLINTHVIIGVMSVYMVMGFLLKNVMRFMLGDFRGISELFDRSGFAISVFIATNMIFAAIVTLNFQVMYQACKDRIEPAVGPSKKLFAMIISHWIYTFVAFVVFSPFYCFGLASCIWIAAIKVLTLSSFEYEVAAKPTKAMAAGL